MDFHKLIFGLIGGFLVIAANLCPAIERKGANLNVYSFQQLLVIWLYTVPQMFGGESFIAHDQSVMSFVVLSVDVSSMDFSPLC